MIIDELVHLFYEEKLVFEIRMNVNIKLTG